MNTTNASEQLLSELVVSLHEMLPAIDFGKVEGLISSVLSNYKVEVQEDYVLPLICVKRLNYSLHQKK